MIVQQPYRNGQGTVHLYPGGRGTIGRRVTSEAEMKQFQGPIFMNMGNHHWVALQSK
jgi:hypothetical protein